MAHLLRLICGLLALWASSASAIIPVSQYKYHFNNNGPLAGYTHYPEIQQACDAALQYSKTVSHPQFASRTWTQVYCRLSGGTDGAQWSLNPSPGYNIGQSIVRTTPGVCPANSSAVSGGCQCNTGYQQNSAATACELPPPECAALAGTSAGLKQWEAGSLTAPRLAALETYTFCDGWNPKGGGKCLVKATRELTTGTTSDNTGVWLNQGIGYYTGATGTTCNGSGAEGAPSNSPKPPGDPEPPVKPNPGEAAPAPCPKGQSPGEVNGARVCAPTGSDVPTESKDEKEVKNPDGSKVNTTEESRCRGGKCTTDTTKCTTAAGSTTQTCETTQTTQSQAALCSANKAAGVCSGDGGDGNGGSFGGDCAAGFKAESDDPVISAMALEQHKRNCLLFEKETEERTAYEADKAKGKLGTDQTGDLGGNNKTVTVGAADFDSSNAFGGGACISDKSITVMGKSVSLPFSRLCDFFGYAGQLLVAVGYLLAARILIRG